MVEGSWIQSSVLKGVGELFEKSGIYLDVKTVLC